MKLSELLAALQALKAEHGDVMVGIDDADTSWTLNIQSVGFDEKLRAVTVSGDYGDQLYS